MKRASRAFFFLQLFLCLGSALAAPVNCPICGMPFEPGGKMTYASVRDGKPVQFDSFTCASRFHARYPDAALSVFDYESGKKLDGTAAYFVVKSRKLGKEVEVGMPPAVAAFPSEAAAKKASQRLGDGEVVHGFDAARKAYD